MEIRTHFRELEHSFTPGSVVSDSISTCNEACALSLHVRLVLILLDVQPDAGDSLSGISLSEFFRSHSAQISFSSNV